MSLAQHAKSAGSDIEALFEVSTRGLSVAKSLNLLYKKGLIRLEIYENDFKAIVGVSTIDGDQVNWITEVLESNSTSNKDTIALPIAGQDSVETVNNYIESLK